MNTLQISTSNATTDQNSRLKYTLRNSMRLSGYISLSNIHVWYNWRNITTALGNNTFSYKFGGGTFDATLPDGSYTTTNINDYLHLSMEANGHFDSTKPERSNDRYDINLYANTTYNRVSIRISAAYEVIFGAGLAKTLGALTSAYSDTGTTFPNVPQLENVKSVQVHCNLVYNEYQSNSSLLYNFTPHSAYGSLLSVEPRFPQWRKTRETTENVIEVWLTDQSGKSLTVEDEWGVILQVAPPALVKL